MELFVVRVLLSPTAGTLYLNSQGYGVDISRARRFNSREIAIEFIRCSEVEPGTYEVITVFEKNYLN